VTTAFDDPRIELARQRAGAVSVLRDQTLPPHLLHLVDSRGNRYYAKQHRHHTRHLRETNAYLNWGPLLKDSAPELVGHQDATRTLLLTAAPGHSCDTLRPGSDEEENAHHNAGIVLGALHRATLLRMTGAIGVELAERLCHWAHKADNAGLVSQREHRLLLRTAEEMAGTLMDSAICHLDYQPRNWLYGDGFWVLDFEHMRRDARIRDFARLEFRRWQAAPLLRDAFYSGYGAHPTDTEQRLLERFGAIEAATALVRGHEQRDHALSAHGRTVLTRLS
jgi:hypothetical protein